MQSAPVRLGGWALVLGASSGFGEAASIALARAGLDIVGIHLDRKATPHQRRAHRRRRGHRRMSS